MVIICPENVTNILYKYYLNFFCGYNKNIFIFDNMLMKDRIVHILISYLINNEIRHIFAFIASQDIMTKTFKHN